ncbi:MAG: glycosyltransferase [Actinomycetales bacterium]|nr:glycosyltransferase [Actinomycetales bacterium]
MIATQLGTMELLGMCDLGDPRSDERWRVVAQYHSSLEAAVRSGDLARAQAACRDADAFALLTAEDADAFMARGLDNATWMENPLQAWPEKGAEPESRIVTFLGRYTPLKGPDVLINAWRILLEDFPDVAQGWSLVMHGSGPDEDRIREAVRGCDRIEVRGVTADPLGVLAEGSVLAMPSLEEGMPLVLAEAMSLGLACVATNCSSGVRALVEDGVTGVLVERGDPASLAAGLARVMASTELRSDLGAAARLRVDRMRQARILDRWEQLLAAVMR